MTAHLSERDVLSRLPPPTAPIGRVECGDLVLFQELLVAAHLRLAEGEFITTLPADGSGARRVFYGRLTADGVARLRQVEEEARDGHAA